MRPVYHFARYEAKLVREAYRRSLGLLVRREVASAGDLEREVVYFSSRADLPEQIASMRSLLRHVGRPRTLIVASDGSHLATDRALLRAAGASAAVDYRELLGSSLPPQVQAYARVHPLGKKLALLMSLPVDGPRMYVDADILFFPSAAREPAQAALRRSGVWYLPDSAHALDERLVTSSEQPVNSGLLAYDRALPWEEVVGTMPAPTRDDLFLEQTLVHLVAHEAEARPLPSELFQVRTDDQFRHRDLARAEGAAMRHYTKTVRNKFWLAIASRF